MGGVVLLGFACVLKKVLVTERERIHLLSFMIVCRISPHGKLLWTSNGGLEILRSLNRLRSPKLAIAL